MSYRIEVSPNNRAGCKDTVCKKEGVKILKGEIRFGTWVTIQEHSSWQWRHWGCVSGEQIKNLRTNIERNGDFDYDMLDGWEELEDHPEVREKVQRVIKQGHIDPEDFNGDPEYNKLGQKGIRGRAKRAKAEDEDGEPTSSAPKSNKRGRKAADVDDDEEEAVKPKKKSKKAAVKDEEGEPEKPAVKGRGKKAAAKVDDEDDDEKPVAKGRGKRATKKAAIKEESEEEVEEEQEPAPPAKKGRARKAAAKKEPTPEEEEEEEEVEEEEPAPKPRGKGGRKSKATTDDDVGPSKPKRGRGRKSAVTNED